MKIIESIALAIATFVLAGIVTGMVGETSLARHLTGTQGLVLWIAVQTAIVAILLSAIRRKPITYITNDQGARP